MPKAGTLAYPYAELQQYLETVIHPLFPEGDLVHQHLVRLGDNVVSRLNEILPKMEALRREDFRGDRVADVEFGMLVEDMDKKDPDDIVLEFKPKWLAQSPNAPASAARCRNCAREALKRSKKAAKAKATSTSTPTAITPTVTSTNSPHVKSQPIRCPLDLLECAVDPSALSRSVDSLATLSSVPLSPSHRRRLARWLQSNTLLLRLRDLQASHDRTGPIAAEAHDSDFQLAMTLRDCSCFVRIPADSDGAVEARLADLDKKNWEAKLRYWQATERELVDGGYYHGTEEPGQLTSCLLERRAAATQ